MPWKRMLAYITGNVNEDLYAIASIQVPAQLTHEQKVLWEQLAAKSPFNPRPTS